MNSIDEWNCYWKNSVQSDALFTDANGKAINDFVVFWDTLLCNRENDQNVLDIACGSGALFNSVSNLSQSHLAGLDCSEHALKLFSQRFPKARTIINTSLELPHKVVEAFDLLVSQFGVEYLGISTIGRLPSQLKQGAEFVGLCHYKGGHIESRYALELKAITLLSELNAVQEAKEIVDRLFSRDDLSTDSSADSLKSNFFKNLEAYREHWNAGTLHFVQGIYQLLTHYKQYNKTDILAWIDGMADQLEVARQRVTAICDVALSEQDIKEIIRLSSCKPSDWIARPFYMANSKLPVAWELRYKKV